LEEIGDIPPDIQAALLTFLEDGKYRKIGSIKEDTAKLQLIGTTNKIQSDFRSDFWNRFNRFYVPSINERRIDILFYLHYLFPDIIKTLTKSEVLALLSYHWPGNVREIENFGFMIEWARAVMDEYYRRNNLEVNSSAIMKASESHHILINQTLPIQFEKIISLFNDLKQEGININYLETVLNEYSLSLDINNKDVAFPSLKKVELETDKDIGFKKYYPFDEFAFDFYLTKIGILHFCKFFWVSPKQNKNLLDNLKDENCVKEIYVESGESRVVNKFFEQKKHKTLLKEIFKYRFNINFPEYLFHTPINLIPQIALQLKQNGNMDIHSLTQKEILREVYSKRLEMCGNNMKKAAESLGEKYGTFRDNLKKLCPDSYPHRTTKQ